jgi:chemotaxis protein CheY-P-specific phosphatase CheC/ActR/RegA family two-component response regulator
MVACRERMQEEVSALLGKNLTFAAPQTKVLSKEEFFSEPAGKSVLAHIKLDGDLEGDGCLIVPVRDAIRIGGTLIMLPESELETVMGEEEYSEELEDSYGEIANIICGSLTAIFEEQYPKSFRLVRTEQEVILPVKVDVESDAPVPNGSYYLMTSAMEMENVEMGTLQLLLPAANFELVEEPTEDSSDVDTSMLSSENDQPETDDTQDADPEEKASTAKSAKSPEDVKKQQERIDLLLNNSLARVGEEVGALLGGTLIISPDENEVLNKEELLDQAGGKQVMARMEVRGDGEGESYLLVSLKDAIFLGGTLIMLPDAELEEVVRNEEFGEDAEDAYGEVANIISGVYTAIFEEQYRKNLGFVKTGLETIIPVKIDPDTDETIPKDVYYLSSGEINFNGQDLGRIQAVFPASLFELESLARLESAVDEEKIQEAPAAGSVSATTEQESPQEVSQIDGGQEINAVGGSSSVQAGADAADILIFTDDDLEAESVAGMLGQQGYTPRILHYRDPVGNFLSSAISLVFLVMKDVNEQGFGMAIKLSSAGIQVPLVAAGPAWTRTTVLKAVKYGAADILITPATTDDIQEKLDRNLVKKAA